MFKTEAEGRLKGILSYVEDPIVSSSTSSAIRTARFRTPLDRSDREATWSKWLAWYDNEWGYSNRSVDLISRVGSFCRQSYSRYYGKLPACRRTRSPGREKRGVGRRVEPAPVIQHRQVLRSSSALSGAMMATVTAGCPRTNR